MSLKTSHHEEISYNLILAILEVKKSGFFSWLKRRNSKKNLEALNQKEEILAIIKTTTDDEKSLIRALTYIFQKSNNTYGSPRIYIYLKKRGYEISEATVARYMRELGLDARHIKFQRRINTTNSNHGDDIADRIFKVEDKETMPEKPGTEKPDEILPRGITYIKLADETHIYLSVVLDIYTREIVGWAMAKTMETYLVLRALYLEGVEIIPSIITSISRKGNCYDNAYVESFFSTLKNECISKIKTKIYTL